jgi:hypothetical protein
MYMAMQAKRAAAVETVTEAEAEEDEEEEEEGENPVGAAAEPDYVVVEPAQGAAKKRRRGGQRHRKSHKDSPAPSDGTLSVKQYIADCVRQGISLDEAQRMWLARNRGVHDPRPAGPSTAAPAEGVAPAPPDDDDMSVSGAASSKRSSTRSHGSKGEAHRRANMQKLARYLESQGQTYNPAAADQMRAQRAEAATGLRGTAATAVHGHLVATRETDQNWARDCFAKLVVELNGNIRNLIYETNIVSETVAWAVSGGKCLLCRKMADGAHETTQHHRTMIELASSISLLCGRPRITRVPNVGVHTDESGLLTQFLVKSFWGMELENMVMVCNSLLQQVKHARFAWPKGYEDVSTEHVCLGPLMIVPYSTSNGMYARWSEKTGRPVKAVLWQNIPAGCTPEDKKHMDDMEVAYRNSIGEDCVVQDDESDMTWWPTLRWIAKEGCPPATAARLRDECWVSCVLQLVEYTDNEVVAWQLYEKK